jgi:deazaflavin-dependent oxidoreductase (nitroreductase family)
MSDRVQLNEGVVQEFRANGGQVASFAGTRLLLLTHTGARTGAQYISPLAYLPDRDRFVVFAANGGRPTNPAWYHNLVAHPEAVVEVGIGGGTTGGGNVESFPVLATLLDGDERERVWAAQVAAAPLFADLQARTSRTIPVVALRRSDTSDREALAGP